MKRLLEWSPKTCSRLSTGKQLALSHNDTHAHRGTQAHTFLIYILPLSLRLRPVCHSLLFLLLKKAHPWDLLGGRGSVMRGRVCMCVCMCARDMSGDVRRQIRHCP